MLRLNPELEENMIPSDLRKYFGIAKREYIKETLAESKNKIR